MRHRMKWDQIPPPLIIIIIMKWDGMGPPAGLSSASSRVGVGGGWDGYMGVVRGYRNDGGPGERGLGGPEGAGAGPSEEEGVR